MLSTDIILAAPEGSQLLNPMLKIIQGRRSACCDQDFIVAIISSQGTAPGTCTDVPWSSAAVPGLTAGAGTASSAPPRCKPSASPQQPSGAPGQPQSSSRTRSHPLALHKGCQHSTHGCWPQGERGHLGAGSRGASFSGSCLGAQVAPGTSLHPGALPGGPQHPGATRTG